MLIRTGLRSGMLLLLALNAVAGGMLSREHGSGTLPPNRVTTSDALARAAGYASGADMDQAAKLGYGNTAADAALWSSAKNDSVAGSTRYSYCMKKYSLPCNGLTQSQYQPISTKTVQNILAAKGTSTIYNSCVAPATLLTSGSRNRAHMGTWSVTCTASGSATPLTLSNGVNPGANAVGYWYDSSSSCTMANAPCQNERYSAVALMCNASGNLKIGYTTTVYSPQTSGTNVSCSHAINVNVDAAFLDGYIYNVSKIRCAHNAANMNDFACTYE